MVLIKVIQDVYGMVRVQDEIDRLFQMLKDAMKDKKLIVVRVIN